MLVLDLTFEVTRKCEKQMRQSFIGDGTCSLENMELSCFASEGCNHNTSLTFDMNDYLNQDVKLVAMQDEVFLGCLTASKLSMSFALKIHFPHLQPRCDSILVSNLCVSSHARGRGVCKAMLHEVFRRHKTIYLLIARPLCINEVTRRLMTERSANLVKMYTHLGFHMVDENPHFYLMEQESVS